MFSQCLRDSVVQKDLTCGCRGEGDIKTTTKQSNYCDKNFLNNLVVSIRPTSTGYSTTDE